MATFLSEKGIFSLVFVILFVKWSLLQLSRAQGVVEDRSNADDGIVPISFGLIVGVAIAGSLVFIMLILVLIALVVCLRSGQPPKSRRRTPYPQHQVNGNYYTNYDTHHASKNDNGGVYVNKAYVYEGQMKSTEDRENNINNRDIQSSKNREIKQEPEQVLSTYHHQEQESSVRFHHQEQVSSTQRHPEQVSLSHHHHDQISSTQRHQEQVSSTHRHQEQVSSTHHHHDQISSTQRHQEHESQSASVHSFAREDHHDHDNQHNDERTQIIYDERAVDVSTPTPQPMYESLDDVEEEYRELPLPDSVDPDVSYHSQWPPRPELTRTRHDLHNLVEIPSDSSSSSSSSPPSVIEMIIHHGHDETDAEVDSYPPPPENFM